MTKANYDDWRDKTEFSDFERSCLLANVEPGGEMTSQEMSRVQAAKGHIEALRELQGKSVETTLFKKLLTL